MNPPQINAAPPSPRVSVLVPARNEEQNLAACLASLASQAAVDYELIVIDDNSSDRTAEIARSFSRVHLISAGPLPAAWCGKQHALNCGVQHARGEWLLFTDADTVHAAGSLARAIAEAQQFGAALLSYSPRQVVRTAWERAVMPVVFAELARAYRPVEVSDPASPAAAANGQYLLMRRDAYEAIGGHAAVRASLLEDVALARLAKQRGLVIRFRYAGDAVSTRMYRSFAALREGWTKNLALLFPRARRLATLRMAEFALITGSAAAAVAAFGSAHAGAGAICVAISVSLYAIFLRRIVRAHFGWLSNLLAIFGLPIFALLLR
ncbi:MAG TPA: glycosyltransferase family 2 protein, partial [Terriglobales bacterium]|nr:glycosyltransferase family 2 protein [Terriglobales bacterium]